MSKKCENNCTHDCIHKEKECDFKYFIVNQYNEVLPIMYKSYEVAQSQCESGETVFLAESEDAIYEMFTEEDN